MTSEPITVVIPTHNDHAHLSAAVESVLQQPYPAHIIIVDDGSRRPVHELVRSIDPAIQVIRQENRGAGAARNTGIRAAGTDLVAFLDADDVWLPNFLPAQTRVLADFPGYSGVLGRSSHHDQDLAAAVRPLSFDSLALTLRGGRSTSGWLFRRKALIEAGTFDPAFRRMQDVELLLRLTGQGFGVLLSNVKVFDYRPSASRGATHGEKHLEALETFTRKYVLDPPSWFREQLSPGDRRKIAANFASWAANVAAEHDIHRSDLINRAYHHRRALPLTRRVKLTAMRAAPDLTLRLRRHLGR